MGRFLILILLLLITNCSNIAAQPTTSWNKTNYHEIDGIVEIATGWSKSPLCTGSLIKKNIILTAAHCAIFPKEDLYIVYGCNKITDNSCKRTSVKKIFTHPKWGLEFFSTNDIAIIIPTQSITIPPAQISLRKNIPKGLSVKGVGFGYRNGTSGILYSGRGRITTDYQYELVAHMQGSLDPNPGDSGGPLLIFEDGRFKIIGILSRSRWSKTSKKVTFIHSGYAIYTKPIMYIDWINEISSKVA